jgi:hypothetical protein
MQQALIRDDEAPVDFKRTKLAQAVVARRQAEAAVKSASEACDRAGRMVAAAQDKAAEFAALDEEIDRHRAELIKCGIEDIHLSPELRDKVRGRNAAREKIADAQSVQQLLADELAAKEVALADAKTRAAEAAAAILIEEAERLGTDLEIAWQTVWRLVDELHGLGSIWAPQNGTVRPLALPPNVVALLQLIAGFDHRQHGGGHNAQLAAASARWKSRFSELLINGE